MNDEYLDGPLTGKICHRLGVKYKIKQVIHLETICSNCHKEDCQYYGVEPLNRSWLYTPTILMSCQLTEKPTFREPMLSKGKYEHLIPEESRQWARFGRRDNRLAVDFCHKLRRLIRPFKALQGLYRRNIGIYAHFPIARVQIGEWVDKLIVVWINWQLINRKHEIIKIDKHYFVGHQHIHLPEAIKERYPVACPSLHEIAYLVAKDIKSIGSDPNYIVQPMCGVPTKPQPSYNKLRKHQVYLNGSFIELSNLERYLTTTISDDLQSL